MLIGRETELRTLENLYKKNSFQMIVMYGRRHVGKTLLISKFVENKPAIFFSAQEANDKINLNVFSKAVFQFFHLSPIFSPFTTWEEAFQFIAGKAKSERFVLAIDEFPYAVQANKSLKSLMQNIIDYQFKDTKIFIILCGSQIDLMEKGALGYKGLLFGRRIAKMKIHGLSYPDASKMLEGFSLEDKIKLYGCIGGTPHYLTHVDHQKSFEDNLLDLYFRVSGPLYNEPTMVLKQEVREPAMYNSIISAIAGGALRLSDISGKIGEDMDKTAEYLETLINLRILYKEYPFGDNPAKSHKEIYKISDNCYRFWYRYVFPERAAIERGAGKTALHSALLDMNRYMSEPFGKICFQHMIYKNNNNGLPFVFTRSGGWWSNNPVTKAHEGIGLVFSAPNHKNIIFAGCKWRDNIKDISVLNKLIEKSALFDTYENKYYYIFSKSEFSEEVQLLSSQNSNIQLNSLNDLFQ